MPRLAVSSPERRFALLLFFNLFVRDRIRRSDNPAGLAALTSVHLRRLAHVATASTHVPHCSTIAKKQLGLDRGLYKNLQILSTSAFKQLRLLGLLAAHPVGLYKKPPIPRGF